MPKTKHGMSASAAYKRWIYMKSRCTYDHRYVTAGITVCERWLVFENFHADMGDPPPGMSLDRIDGTRGYSPDNCRWADVQTQNQNLKSNIRVNGELLSNIARRVGVGVSTVQYRHANGLPLDEPPIQERDHCKAGHPWSEENTYWAEVPRKQGGTRMQRYCRKCRAEHQAQLRLRRSAD